MLNLIDFYATYMNFSVSSVSDMSFDSVEDIYFYIQYIKEISKYLIYFRIFILCFKPVSLLKEFRMHMKTFWNEKKKIVYT